MKEVREALLGHLTAALGNDVLAAEFMLLHLLSKVYGSYIVTVLNVYVHVTCYGKSSIHAFVVPSYCILFQIKNLKTFCSLISFAFCRLLLKLVAIMFMAGACKG